MREKRTAPKSYCWGKLASSSPAVIERDKYCKTSFTTVCGRKTCWQTCCILSIFKKPTNQKKRRPKTTSDTEHQKTRKARNSRRHTKENVTEQLSKNPLQDEKQDKKPKIQLHECMHDRHLVTHSLSAWHNDGKKRKSQRRSEEKSSLKKRYQKWQRVDDCTEALQQKSSNRMIG